MNINTPVHPQDLMDHYRLNGPISSPYSGYTFGAASQLDIYHPLLSNDYLNHRSDGYLYGIDGVDGIEEGECATAYPLASLEAFAEVGVECHDVAVEQVVRSVQDGLLQSLHSARTDTDTTDQRPTYESEPSAEWVQLYHDLVIANDQIASIALGPEALAEVDQWITGLLQLHQQLFFPENMVALLMLLRERHVREGAMDEVFIKKIA